MRKMNPEEYDALVKEIDKTIAKFEKKRKLAQIN